MGNSLVLELFKSLVQVLLGHDVPPVVKHLEASLPDLVQAPRIVKHVVHDGFSKGNPPGGNPDPRSRPSVRPCVSKYLSVFCFVSVAGGARGERDPHPKNRLGYALLYVRQGWFSLPKGKPNLKPLTAPFPLFLFPLTLCVLASHFGLARLLGPPCGSALVPAAPLPPRISISKNLQI